MHWFAHGTLCLIDGAEAMIRSGSDMIQFMLRSSFIAWIRFDTLALKSLSVRHKEGYSTSRKFIHV